MGGRKRRKRRKRKMRKVGGSDFSSRKLSPFLLLPSWFAERLLATVKDGVAKDVCPVIKHVLFPKTEVIVIVCSLCVRFVSKSKK